MFKKLMPVGGDCTVRIKALPHKLHFSEPEANLLPYHVISSADFFQVSFQRLCYFFRNSKLWIYYYKFGGDCSWNPFALLSVSLCTVTPNHQIPRNLLPSCTPCCDIRLYIHVCLECIDSWSQKEIVASNSLRVSCLFRMGDVWGLFWTWHCWI